MKFFIDTADVGEIREAHAMGVLDGVTTNPSLVAKTGRKFADVLEEICQIVEGPVSAEVVATKAEPMLLEARELARVSENIVVKVPLTAEGIKATRVLSGEAIKTNLTLCFSATQALLAAKVGASYVSPFVGRLDDISQEGMELIAQIKQIYENYGFQTEILVASVRSPEHVRAAALLGADVATCPFKVIGQLVRHPLTDVGLERFLKDWQSVPQ